MRNNELAPPVEKNKKTFSKINIPHWTIPVFLLFETVVAYGLLAIYEGFYFDDWQMVWLANSGTSYWEFYSFDRPFSAWTLYVTAPILGSRPLAWHGFMIILRWLVTWSGWWVLKLIWPKNYRINILVAMLFGVYPAFLQHSISVAYSQHFITYLFFFLSIGLMIKSFKGESNSSWLFAVLGLFSQAIHLFTMEYFWGLEIVRVLVIYYCIEAANFWENFRRVLTRWLPYFIIYASAIFWRVAIFAPVEDPNQFHLLDMFLKQPLSAMLQLLEMILQDSLHLLIKAWELTLQVNLIDLQDPVLLAIWGISIAVFVSIVLYSKFLRLPADGSLARVMNNQLAIFGLAILILGPFPAWLTGRQITVGLFSDRFALGGMLGAAITLVVLFDRIMSTKLQVLASVAILAGLAIGLHIRTSNAYRWAWITQQRLYWQMHWRVPYLEPGTAIFSDGAIFQYTGDYPTAFALNLLYAQDDHNGTKLPYWFFELDRGFHLFPNQYLNNQVMEGRLRTAYFKGRSLDSILIDYSHRQGSCLWVVGQGDELVYALPAITRKALPLSDLGNISATARFVPHALFGEGPAHTWCYYFQKAELARQFEDWDQVSLLGDEVIRNGYEPQNRFEWRPYVDGYLHTEDFQSAYEITLLAFASDNSVRDLFCTMWIEHVREYPNDSAVEFAEQVEDELLCKW